MYESLDQEIRTLQSIFWSERDPDGLAFASLADAFRRKGEVREALDLLTDGMSRHPEFVTGHAIATKLYHDQGMDFEAELAARRVLELDPENLVGLSTLATLLTAKGEVDEAGRMRTTLLSVDPDSEEARALEGLDLGPADASPADPAEITELVPETMYQAGSPDSLLDDLTLAEPDGSGMESGVAEEELSAAMDSLGLVSEDDDVVPDMDAAESAQEGFPGPEVEFADLDALVDDDVVGSDDDAEGGDIDLGAGGLDLVALTPDEPEAMDLGDLAPDEPEAVDLAALAPDEPEAVDLAALAPDEPEAMDLGDLAPDEPEAMDLDDLAPDEPEAMDLGDLAPDEPEAMDLAALAPDEPEAMDLAALAPDEPEAMDLAALAPDEPEAMDLAALAPDEPEAVDLAALAPDEPEAMDLGDLAPDEPEAMDLAALAPDEPEAMDLAALAPDEPEAMDLAALAPDEPEAMDLAALAPDEPEAVDLAALAPDEPEAMDLGDLAPDEPEAVDLDALAPDEPRDVGGTEPPDEPAEPIYTRTLADLYIKQGFDDKALEVLKALHARHPGDAALAKRIATLEGGGTPTVHVSEAQSHGEGHSEDEVEARARELAEHGLDGSEDVDSPFAWNQEGSEDGDPDEPPAGNYFDALLAWENRAES